MSSRHGLSGCLAIPALLVERTPAAEYTVPMDTTTKAGLHVILLVVVSVARWAPAVDVPAPLEPVHFARIKLDGFWKQHVKRLTEKWIPHCIKQMEAGGKGQELLNLVHTAEVLKGNPPGGKFTGCPWSDAYVYNTVEAICLALAVDPVGDADLAAAQQALRAKMEEWIPIILAAQCEDGYIHSFHVVNKFPRYSKIHNHEFYVQGYFIEMGVAHYQAAGGKDRRLYDAARKCADLLCETFGPAPKRTWVHGHPGMEIALCRLGRLVNQVDGPGKGDKYIALTRHQYETRHTVKEYRNAYHQSHLPAVEQGEALGHAVRGTYFFAGIADIAMLQKDPAYLRAADRLWDSAVNRKLYLTGGVGASHKGEAFDADYELRNDGYCEACAGCGQSFWADRMHRIHRSGHYADVQERVLYNNVLGSIELSGENFYYQNPLTGDRARYPWHGCPCCVGNIPRTLIAIKDLAYSLNDAKDTLYVNQFVSLEGVIADVAGTQLRIAQQTEYPWKGEVTLTLHPAARKAFTVKLRVPSRADSALYTTKPDLAGRCEIKVNGQPCDVTIADGYAAVRRDWADGDRIQLTLPMDVQRVYCDERAKANLGRVALQRGPIVYNVESVDHKADIRSLVLPPSAALRAEWRGDLLGGVTVIRSDEPDLLAVPNYARLNRGGRSQVWLVEDPQKAVDDRPFIRKDLDKRTIDAVLIGDEQSEKQHAMKGERTSAGTFQSRPWRHAPGGGWFSYDLAVKPDAKLALLCTYWGDDGGNRQFDILVDGQKVGHQKLDRNKPGKFFDIEYPLPAELLKDKKKITVRLQAEKGATAGGAFDIRIVRVE